METWKLILISVVVLGLIIALAMFLWFFAVLMIINFIFLNLDTIFTNRPVRFVFTGAQLERLKETERLQEAKRRKDK
jgi:hypothetical protein